MTFHAGNGVTLSKEEENLPEEERNRIVEQKQQAVEFERNGGEMKPIDYESPEVQEELDRNDRINRAVNLVNRLDAEKNAEKDKAAPAAAKPTEDPLPQGSYGIRKNEDFTEYRRKKAEARSAARDANNARMQAEEQQRQNLLASGKFFDDGRGNLKLKKAERQYVAGLGRKAHLRTAADNGFGNGAVRDAGQTAWTAALANQQAVEQDKALNYTRSAVQTNREAMKIAEQQKAERAKMASKSKLGVFDGFAAALDAMNASEAQEETRQVWGGKDEQGRDGRWTYDAHGRVNGQAAPRQEKTGLSVKRGFVTPELLKNINLKLNERGADYNITGIMASQKIGAIGKPLEGQTPQFYIQGVRNDGTKFGQMMTLKDVYRWGVESFRDSGSEGDAQEFAINALGGYDPDGYRQTPEYKGRLLKASGGAGVETAQIYANQRANELEFKKQKQADDMAFRQQKQESDAAFRDKKLQFDVSKAMSKEAKEFFSSMSDDDKKAFSTKFPEIAKSILGMSEAENPDKAAIKPGDNSGDEFVQLSREEFAKLSDEEKEDYKNRWKAWKQSQAK